VLKNYNFHDTPVESSSMFTAYHMPRRMFNKARPVCPEALEGKTAQCEDPEALQVHRLRGSSKENAAGLPAEPTPPK
jgi:hypothetical protein